MKFIHMNYIFIIKIYINLAYKIYWLNRRYTNKLFKELDIILRKEDLSMSKDLKKRIFFYTAQCYIFSSWTCALRGEKLTKKEKDKVIYLGALTPILDDLTDSLKTTSTDILYFLNNNQKNEKQEIILAKYLYNQLQGLNNKYFNEAFEKALISQDVSMQQLEEVPLSDNELKEIDCGKGGKSVIVFRTILDPPLKQGEMEALTTLGYLMQQTNDMFDIYKDYQNKDQTLFSNSKNINKNYIDYKENIDKLISQYYKLDYKNKAIEKCLLEISTITSRGMVCANQLLSLQGNKDEFNIEEFTRDQLICDMEKVSNIISSIAYSAKLYDKLKTYNK